MSVNSLLVAQFVLSGVSYMILREGVCLVISYQSVVQKLVVSVSHLQLGVI